MEKILYLSHSLSAETPLYGGHSGIEVKKTRDLCQGDSSNSLWISMPNHASTHVDVPSHFIAGGKSVTDFDPGFWIFGAISLWTHPVNPGHLIGSSPKEFPSLKPETELLLIQTGFEAHRGTSLYWEKSPGLAPGLAVMLRERCPKLRAVGVDFISISSLLHREKGREAHREFLAREIVLIEDMKLSPLEVAPRKVIVAPLLLQTGDGAPATVFAIPLEY